MPRPVAGISYDERAILRQVSANDEYRSECAEPISKGSLLKRRIEGKLPEMSFLRTFLLAVHKRAALAPHYRHEASGALHFVLALHGYLQVSRLSWDRPRSRNYFVPTGDRSQLQGTVLLWRTYAKRKRVTFSDMTVRTISWKLGHDSCLQSPSINGVESRNLKTFIGNYSLGLKERNTTLY